MIFRDLFRRATGVAKTDEQAHQIKNEMTHEILEINRRVHELNQYIKDTKAYKIAKATGRVK